MGVGVEEPEDRDLERLLHAAQEHARGKVRLALARDDHAGVRVVEPARATRPASVRRGRLAAVAPSARVPAHTGQRCAGRGRLVLSEALECSVLFDEEDELRRAVVVGADLRHAVHVRRDVLARVT